MKIALLAFAGSEATMGLTLVSDTIAEEIPDAEVRWADEPAVAKEADYLLVSLYWWRDSFEFVRYLATYGIDPRQRRPTIIIGGMVATSPAHLTGYYHHAVVGDGEAVIVGLLRRLEAGEPTDGMDGVWSPDGCRHADMPILRAVTHVDVRTNKTARIELARGCKQMCDFCQLAWEKPYRELPFEQVQHLIRRSPTKNIALFAPDVFSHTRAFDIMDACMKCGKNNTGSDVRLDELDKVKKIARVRFGIEGFSERTRKRFRKVRTNADLERLFVHMATGDITTLRGSPITTATAYLIADLPGEGREDVEEFWGVLAAIDRRLQRKFTLYLSVSSFAPSPHTPMWGCGISLHSPFKEWFDSTRPRYKNIVIATRGGLRSPASRMCQMLTVRGDERVARAVFWLATKAHGILESRAQDDAKLIARVIHSAGFDPNDLTREYGEDDRQPWMPIQTWTDAWKTKAWADGAKA